MPAYKRIISLVPSLTELLIDLGLKEYMAGRTKFCVHPEGEVESIEIIGGTKNPDIEHITSLNPDFILANKEENKKKDIEKLSIAATTMVTEIDSVSDALIAIHEIGQLFERETEATNIIEQINKTMDAKPETPPLRTIYLIWKNPWMTVGKGTYIHDVMQSYHLQNLYGNQRRYPRTTLEEMQELNPEVVLLSTEPYPFKEENINELRAFFPDAKVELVNGEWFSWYGSRMYRAFDELNSWRTSLQKELA